MRACTTWFKWSTTVEDHGHIYVVQMVEKFDPNVNIDFGYACDCGEHQPCIHVLSVKGTHCGWNPLIDHESGIVPDECPRCGSPIIEAEPESTDNGW